MVEAINQGTCTECGESDDNYYQLSRSHYISTGITREVQCDCGARATVRITDDGIDTEGAISHENASWQ